MGSLDMENCGRIASRKTKERTKAQGWSRSGSQGGCSYRSKAPGELWLEKTEQTWVEARLWRLRDVGFIQETGEIPIHFSLQNDTTYFPFHVFLSKQKWKVNFPCSFTPYWLDHKLGSGHRLYYTLCWERREWKSCLCRSGAEWEGFAQLCGVCRGGRCLCLAHPLHSLTRELHSHLLWFFKSRMYLSVSLSVLNLTIIFFIIALDTHSPNPFICKKRIYSGGCLLVFLVSWVSE